MFNNQNPIEIKNIHEKSIHIFIRKTSLREQIIFNTYMFLFHLKNNKRIDNIHVDLNKNNETSIIIHIKKIKKYN